MTRKLFALLALFLLAGAMTVPMVGCEEEGPGERMGRDLDEAGEDLRDAAEDLGDDLD